MLYGLEVMDGMASHTTKAALQLKQASSIINVHVSDSSSTVASSQVLLQALIAQVLQLAEYFAAACVGRRPTPTPMAPTSWVISLNA
jgi:hypothetical protein